MLGAWWHGYHASAVAFGPSIYIVQSRYIHRFDWVVSRMTENPDPSIAVRMDVLDVCTGRTVPTYSSPHTLFFFLAYDEMRPVHRVLA
jgi:hypothetical protein